MKSNFSGNPVQYDNRYNTVTVVRRTGSYSTAAALLGRTPSAIVQQIHSLEDDLGVVLFRKDGKKLVPTKECDLVTEYAGRINSLNDRLGRELDYVKMRLDHLVIGVTSSIESGALSRVLSNFRQDESEKLQITIVTDVTDVLCDMLLNCTVDIAVVDGDIPDNTFNSVILDTDHLVVAVPPDSSYARRKSLVTIDEFRNENLILRPKGSGTRNLFEANLKRIGMRIDDFKVMMEIDNVSTIRKLVSSGYGVSILSGRACEKAVEKGQLATIQPCDLSMIRNIHILYRKDFHGDALIQRIQSLYSEIDWSDPVGQ